MTTQEGRTMTTQTKTAHTAGPWRFHDKWIEADIDGGNTIATVTDWEDKFGPEQAANALLIAAAPEMLEALNELSNMYSSAWDLVDGGLIMMADSVPRFEAAHAKADVAIKKARGGQ